MFKWTILLSLIISFDARAADIADGLDEESGLEFSKATGTLKYEISNFLTTTTLGNDGFYNKALSPAKSLNLNLSDADRIQEINTKISNEMGVVIAAFNGAAETNKLDTLKKILSQIDPDILKNGGANIKFFNGSPSAAFSRTFIMIEKKSGNARISADQVLKSFSSYKRSAIPSTHIYEYSDAHNLSQSTIKTTIGNNDTWRTPLAAPAIQENQDLVLKKCRQIFGWKCVTAMYHPGQLSAGTDNLKYLYAGVHDLTSNTDSPEFMYDKRSFNQITGSTAFYFIKESSDWILLYGVDAQWNTGPISFTGLIQDEFLKDSKRVKERLSLDLNLSFEEIK